MGFRQWIMEPGLPGMDVEGPERIRRHREILARKTILRGVFAEFYHSCMALDRRYFGDTPGPIVELGAGVSMFKTYYPELVVTDIVPADHLDAVLDAQAMTFGDASVRSFVGLNCFHHFPKPDLFFRELLRVLRPGGGCVLLDPYWGPVASALYKRLFATETFDKSVPGWDAPEHGVMMGANQALSYIVFHRDREVFARKYPDLELVHTEPLGNYLRYLLSGGLNFRQMVPGAAEPVFKMAEKILRPMRRVLALHHLVVLRKRKS